MALNTSSTFVIVRCFGMNGLYAAVFNNVGCKHAIVTCAVERLSGCHSSNYLQLTLNLFIVAIIFGLYYAQNQVQRQKVVVFLKSFDRTTGKTH